MPENKFSGNLRAALAAADLTQAELAERAGCTQPDISRYLSSGRVPSGDKLVALALALGTTAERLITGQAQAYNSLDLPVPGRKKSREKLRRLAAQAAEAVSALRAELEKAG